MRRPILAVLSAALLLAGCTGDDGRATDARGTTTGPATTAPSTGPVPATTGAPDTSSAAGGTPGQHLDLVADLTGEAAHPGPGDDAGSGSFRGTVTVTDASGELCYELQVRGLSMPVAAAHVHRGAAGQAGEVVVPLHVPGDGSGRACVEVAPRIVARLVASPSLFYVNVHTDDYPDGAVRGQLERDE